MNKELLQAYRVLHDLDPSSEMLESEIAKDILKGWNVPKLGEDLAKEVLFQVILHIRFEPAEGEIKLTKEIVGQAEEKIVELFPEVGFQDGHIHMDDVADLERKYHQEKERSQELKNRTK